MSKLVKPRAESGRPEDAKRSQPEMMQIVVYGSRPGVDQIVREFYLCRFSESTEWTSPQPVPNNPDQVMITRAFVQFPRSLGPVPNNPDQVMITYTCRLRSTPHKTAIDSVRSRSRELCLG